MRPLILAPCNTHRPADGPPLSVVNEKYIRAIRDVCGGIPLLVPAVASPEDDLDELVARADGVLLTGSATMVDPGRYGGVPADGVSLNRDRDAVAFALLHSALRRGKPLLGICRGAQEINVALGGSLRSVQGHGAVAGAGHWQEKYRPVHRIRLAPGGRLAALAAAHAPTEGDRAIVNSLHREAVARLADGLLVEARADDGTIEAVSVRYADAFAVGVQWHAEWLLQGETLSRALLAAFGDACRRSARDRYCPASAGRAVGRSLPGNAFEKMEREH